MFGVNVLGPVHFVQAVVPHMIDSGGGRVVNISSLVGHAVTSRPRNVSYGVSKAAVQNLTATMAKEFAPAVAVNCVSPGFAITEMSEGWNENAWADSRRSLPQRPAEPGGNRRSRTVLRGTTILLR